MSLRCHADRMTRLVARIDDDLAALVDELVASGAVDSRADAVRRGLCRLIDDHRRAGTAEAIVRGYTDQPQTDSEAGWSDDATVAMIYAEPW